jgi:RNase P subunit RPR2
VQPKVALTPTCAECGDVWLPADTDRWKLIFDAYDELVWVCPECDQREFGSGG